MERIFGFNSDEARPRMKPFALTVLLLAAIISSAYLGSRFSAILGICAAISAATVMLAFSKSPFCFILTAFAMFVIWYYTGSIRLATFFCAFATSVGTGAFLLKTTRSPYLISMIPASYLLAYLSGGSALAALISLSVFPVITVLSVFFKGDRGRINVICRVSASILAIGAIAAVAYIITSQRSLTLEAINSTTSGIFDRILEHYTAEYASMADRYSALGIESPSAADIRLYTLAVYRLLPSMIVIAANVISFISYQLKVSLLNESGQRKHLTRFSLSFSMSWISALIFIVAYFVTMITSSAGDDKIALVAENIYMILLPGLVFTGILALLGRREGGRKHFFWLTAIIILFFVSPNIALFATAFIGCSVIISAALGRLLDGGKSD